MIRLKKHFFQSFANQLLSCIPSRATERVVLATSFAAAILAWHLTNNNFESRNQNRFQAEAEWVRGRIEKRMEEYEQVLRGGVGLFNTSLEVTREDWHSYVQTCEVQRHFPGIQAMAVTEIVPVESQEAFIEKVRAEGFDDFRIHPPGSRGIYTAIVYIEPFDWRNQRAFGYDMYSEPIRREAMDRAAETGLPSISGRITLLQETEKNVQPGVLCYLPIYSTNKIPATVESRRQAIRGWVYAAFRLNDLMDGIVGRNNSNVAFRIYDSPQTANDNLLFDSEFGSEIDSNNQYKQLARIDVSGREWTIEFIAKPEFFDSTQTLTSWLVALGGVLFNGLLFVVMHSLKLQRESAIQRADKMAAGFEASEFRTQLILENASEAILSVSDEGKIIAANRAAHRVFNASNTLVDTPFDALVPDIDLAEVIKNSDEKSDCGENGVTVSCRQTIGREFPGRLSVGTLREENDGNYIVIVRDETARVIADKRQKEMTRELITASHKVGKAEIVTGVLHNVGNVVNSINVAAGILREQVNVTPIHTLSKASQVITENEDDLASFFENDERAAHFPELLRRLVDSFEDFKKRQIVELETLLKNIQHVKEVITIQQTSAKKSSVAEPVAPQQLFEDAIKMNEGNLNRTDIRIIRNFDRLPLIKLRKHDVLQILVNLLKNAAQATEMSNTEEKRIELRVTTVDKLLHFSVRDNGIGIPQENIERIFTHGFTTKKTGHGFGLHSCFNAAEEMGGSLMVESPGLNQGATFSLRLPLEAARPSSSPHVTIDLNPNGFPRTTMANAGNTTGML